MSNPPPNPNGPKPKTDTSKSVEVCLKRKRGVFYKDLQHMMYGFGDDVNPLSESVALVEDIAVEYITDLVHKANDIASTRGKPLPGDFVYVIRKDLPKVNRCKELLRMNQELKAARQLIDMDEKKLAKEDFGEES